MSKIKFGTDGWRAIIAEDFTVENLKRVSKGTADWMKEKYPNQAVVIGYDCRFNGKYFADVVASVFAHEGIKAIVSLSFVSTPVVSLVTKRLEAGCGIIITASHNPPEYSGFKIKGNYGGPALPHMIDEVEALVPDVYDANIASLGDHIEAKSIEYVDMESIYVLHAEENFDLNAIKNSHIRIGYDAMYGAGQNVVKRLLPNAFMMHSEFNPSFRGTAPEPIMKNLQALSNHIVENKNIDFAFATDGDADRIGVLNRKGEFIDSHHIILMLVKYLKEIKGLSGKVVNSFSCTSKITDLCNQLKIEQTVTKIGFKYICGHMIDEDVLLGGEESGGIAVTNHISERDGVWIALTLLEYMAKTNKKLEELIQEVYDAVGQFAMERYDLHVEENLKQRIIQQAKTTGFEKFGKYKVNSSDDTDGFKYHLDNGRWVMLRASGTEPVLRVYSEAENSEIAFDILNEAKEALLN